jgi:hypothetical protein
MLPEPRMILEGRLFLAVPLERGVGYCRYMTATDS